MKHQLFSKFFYGLLAFSMALGLIAGGTSVVHAAVGICVEPVGGMNGCAYNTIQEAIDDTANVPDGSIIYVYPGDYSETATARPSQVGGAALYQFGLFIGRPLTIQGVKTDGTPVTDFHDAAARVETNATNNFGYSGIYVLGDDVTVSGLVVLPNKPSDNKTFEVLGNNFTLENSVLDIEAGGSVYFNDAAYDGATGTAHLESYHVRNNLFKYGSSVDITSGAGASGPVTEREITGNYFDLAANIDLDPEMEVAYWAVVSFNSNGTPVPWFVNPVGGAIITGNIFTQGDQYIRLRGMAIPGREGEFDWASYWNDNTFLGGAAMVGADLPAQPNAYSYISGTYNMSPVYRIGGLLQAEVDHAQPGDTVLVKGAFAEDVHIVADSVTLKADGSASLDGGVLIDGDNVTVEGLTITGGAVNDEVYGVYVRSDGVTLRGLDISGITAERGTGFVTAVTAVKTGLLVEDCFIHDNWRGAFLNTSANVTIRRTHFKDNNGVGVGLASDWPTNLVLENNIFEGHTMEGWGTFEPVNVTVRYNQFLGNTNHIHDYSTVGTLDVSENYWGSSMGPVVGTLAGVGNFNPFCANAACTEFSSLTTLDTDNDGQNEMEAVYSSLAGGTANVTLAGYSENPQADVPGLIGVGNQFLDILVLENTDLAATVTLKVEAADGEVLRFWDGSNWLVAHSNDGSIPVGTGGYITIVFGSGSTPRLSELTGTEIVAAAPEALAVQFAAETVQQSQTITAQVVAKSSSLYGVEAHLSFDPALLQVTNVALGGGLAVDSTGQNTFDNVNGTIDFAFTQTADAHAAAVTGDNIVVATITFLATQGSTGDTTVGLAASPVSVFSGPNGLALGTSPATLLGISDTVTVQPETKLSGVVTLQGRSSHRGVSVKVAGPSAFLRFLSSNSQGAYSWLGMVSGDYTLTARFPGYLTANRAQTLAAGSNAIPTVELKGGDANHDGKIDVLDLSYIGARFLAEGAQQADINGDGVVNIVDLAMAGANYNLTATGW